MSQKQPKYFLIDDDESFCKIIQRQAESMGVQIDYATSFDKKDTAQLVKYDAVLLDYDLDDTTGFDIADHLNTSIEHIPVVMVSSTNRPTQDNLAKLANIAGFVTKWGNPNEFVTSVFRTANERPGIKLAS